MKNAGMSRRQRKLARLAAVAAADYMLPGSGKAAKALLGKKPRSKRRQKNRTSTSGSYTRQSENIPAAEGDVIHHTTKRHKFVVEEEELVANVLGNTSAVPAVNRLRINPRNPATFPWMSALANAFELYKFTKLEFYYAPACGTAEKGTVTLGIDYESQDAVLTTEPQLMAIPGSSQGPAYRRISSKAVGGGRSLFAKDLFLDEQLADDNMKNVGNFFYMVSGTTSASTAVIGRLFVRYRVELTVQQITTAGALKGRGWYGTWQDNETTPALVFGGPSFVTPTLSGASEDYMLWTGTADGLIFRIPGAYLAILYIKTTTSITADMAAKLDVTNAVTPTGGITFVDFGDKLLIGDAGTVFTYGPGYVIYLLNVHVPRATWNMALAINGGGTFTDIDLASLLIVPVNSSALLSQASDEFAAQYQLMKDKMKASKLKPPRKIKTVYSICDAESECPAEEQDMIRFEKKKTVIEKSPLSSEDKNVKRRSNSQRESDL